MKTCQKVLFSTFLAVLLLVLMPTWVYAQTQNFSFGVDASVGGVVNNSNNQLATGAGLSVGLVHLGPFRFGTGFGFVYYPNRPTTEKVLRPYVVEELNDDSDLIFTASTGFRVSERRHRNHPPAVYLTFSYMRALTAKDFGLGKVSNGFLMGLTFSSR